MATVRDALNGLRSISFVEERGEIDFVAEFRVRGAPDVDYYITTFCGVNGSGQPVGPSVQIRNGSLVVPSSATVEIVYALREAFSQRDVELDIEKDCDLVPLDCPEY